MGKQTASAIFVAAAIVLSQGCGRWTLTRSEDDRVNDIGSTSSSDSHFELSSLEKYRDCSDLQDRLQARIDEYNEQYNSCYKGGCQGTVANAPTADAAGSGSPNQQGAAGGSKESITNVQERGIDEADRLKVGAQHLYVSNRSGVHVVDRKSLKELPTIDTKDLSETILYAYGTTLIVVGVLREDHIQATVARIYNMTEGQNSKLEKEHRFLGHPIGSRLVDKKLVLVISSEVPTISSRNPEADRIQIPNKDGMVSDVECRGIARSPEFRGAFPSMSLQKVAVIDTSDSTSAPQMAATHDGGDQIYMGQKGLYIFRSGWDYRTRDPKDGSRSLTVVTKVSFDPASGAPVIVARGAVPGQTKDQWAFHEIADKDLLSVATTEGHVSRGAAEDAPTSSNHLIVLEQKDERLTVKSKVAPFGLNEDIRAVRYVGAMAYVVTFKKTDPLFAFDLSDPSNPTQLGELKIPGFSVYMHPISKGRMIGVGFDAADMGDFAWFQGLQVSLFDISNPKEMKRVDNHIVGARGSYSDVTGDHHAFFFDGEKNLMALPAVELATTQENAPKQAYGDKMVFSGAIMYETSDDALKESGRVTHQEMVPEKCRAGSNQGRWWQDHVPSMDINRVISLDDGLLSVSRFGIKRHSFKAPYEAEAKVTFSKGDDECAGSPRSYY